MWLNVACGLSLTSLELVFDPLMMFIALPISVGWCIAPIIMAWLSRQPARKPFLPDQKQKLLLRQTSREIWSFFETFATAKENWLPLIIIRKYRNRRSRTVHPQPTLDYHYWLTLLLGILAICRAVASYSV